MFSHKTSAWMTDFLPWRVRRSIERLQLKSLRFVTGLDSMFVQDGQPSASVTAVGDMAFTTRGGAISEDIEQFKACLDPILGDSDVRLGNLESVLSDAEKSKQSIGTLLRGSPRAISLLTATKMDVLSLANNHARDCQIAGLLDCCKLLEEHGIQYCGAGTFSTRSRSPAQIGVRGLKIGVLGYCDNYRIEGDESENQAPLAAEDERILADIRSLRPQVDLLVVQLHWGYEFCFHPLISYRNRARSYAEAGADLVLCHHAHMLMGVEVWNRSVISHGLGNFVFPPFPYLQEGHPWTNRSYALKVFFNRSGVLRADIVPFAITADGLPQVGTGTAKAEILGAVAKASCRLTDDLFLDWIERDRTLRDACGLLAFFLKSQPPIDREIALQLRSPFRQDCIERLRTRYGHSEERAAQLLSEMAEASRTPQDFVRFSVTRMPSEIKSVLEALRASHHLPNVPPGRVP